MATNPFKTKAPAELRTHRWPVFLTTHEAAQIKEAAEIRALSVGDYFRRCALGRRADVRYEREIVLALSRVVQAIRAMHVDLVERGVAPTAEGFRPVIEDARAAMSRIQP